ncbi:unnamed protein product, partial [marine sediment metagenome]
SIRIREVRCGKANCKKCPHKIYAYLRYRQGKKVKEKYLGVAREAQKKKYDPERNGKNIAEFVNEMFEESEKADLR